jgi:hypothetical protein
VSKDIFDTARGLDMMYRSEALYTAIVAEELVSECIAWHFCADEEKHLTFMALLFNRGEVPFSKKLEIFEFILKASYPDLYALHPQLINQLNSLRRLRNKFAHADLAHDREVSDESGKKIFLRYLNRDGKMVEELFRERELRGKLSEGSTLLYTLLYILAEFKHRAFGGSSRTWEEIFRAVEGYSPDEPLPE